MGCNLIDMLQGKWRFARQVKELNINMSGMARFMPLSAFTLGYEESGNYIYQQNEYDFFQKYRFSVQSNKLLIIKSDASVLHEFMVAETVNYPISLNHTHVCGHDNYNCQLILREPDFWQMLYVVKGHNKNYSISTDFYRI